MGALELVWKINRERIRGDGVLRGMRLVSDLDREPQIRDANAVDSQFPMIGLILRIDESGRMLRVHRSRI
jgi:hypothetical protein